MRAANLYLTTWEAFQEETDPLLSPMAHRLQKARRVKILDFWQELEVRSPLQFPLIVEGLDYLLLHASPEAREIIMGQLRMALSRRIGQMPNRHIIFLIDRRHELTEKEVPRTIALRELDGSDEVLLHPLISSGRWRSRTTANGKQYFEIISLA